MTETWLNVLIYLQSDIKPGVKGINGSICRYIRLPRWWFVASSRRPHPLYHLPRPNAAFCTSFIYSLFSCTFDPSKDEFLSGPACHPTTPRGGGRWDPTDTFTADQLVVSLQRWMGILQGRFCWTPWGENLSTHF